MKKLLIVALLLLPVIGSAQTANVTKNKTGNVLIEPLNGTSTAPIGGVIAPTSGAVTSVSISGGSYIGVSGSPITGSGTISLSLSSAVTTQGNIFNAAGDLAQFTSGGVLPLVQSTSIPTAAGSYISMDGSSSSGYNGVRFLTHEVNGDAGYLWIFDTNGILSFPNNGSWGILRLASIGSNTPGNFESVGGSGSGAFGGSITLNGGSAAGAYSGNLDLSGGTTYPGGSINLKNGAGTITLGTGGVITLPASGTLATTSDLSGYLPKSGGTLTGSLSGTSATFTGTVSGASASFSGTVSASSFSGSGSGLTSIPVTGISATGTSSSTTYLRGDGTWSTPSGSGGGGTVTSVASGNLSPIFTSSVSGSTGSASISYSLTSAAAYSWFGNATASATSPSYNTSAIPVSFLPSLGGDVTSSSGSSSLTVTKINGTALSGLATGILKNTTTTGVPSIAVASDFPTLNQNTSGTAAGLSAALSTAYLYPNLSAAMSSSFGTTNGGVLTVSAGTFTSLSAGSATYVLTSNGAGSAVSWQAPNTTNIQVPVRQTVISGPVDTSASGLPTFLPSTSASTTLTTQNISTGSNAVVATSANGFTSTGATNSVGIATSNFSWSLPASTTSYLYVSISGGTFTAGSTTLQPIYQAGGTPSTTNGQFTFNTSQMIGYMGNGSSAPQANIVFVGEAVTGASSVTSTIAYSYQGKYDSGYFSVASSTNYTKTHNIGVVPTGLQWWFKDINGYPCSALTVYVGSSYYGAGINAMTAYSSTIVTQNTTTNYGWQNQISAIRVIFTRGF